MKMNKKYCFPEDLTAINSNGCLLLVSPNNANWIVLENQTQASITKDLVKGERVGDVLKKYSWAIDDCKHVIGEIEGRHFTETSVYQEEGFILRIYLTHACNLRCRHCFMYAGKPLENELSANEIMEIIKKCKQSGCNKVIFTGGEVTQKKELLRILQYAKSQDLEVQVLTNGQDWTDEMIAKASQLIDEIQISVDGYDEISNSEVRGAHTFRRALSVVEKFMRTSIKHVCVVVTPMYERISAHKQDFVTFGKQLVKTYDASRFLLIFNKELINGREVRANKKTNELMSKIIDEMYEEIYPNAELTTFIMNHKCRMHKSCGYGGLTIDSNGDFFFCGRVNDVKSYGNVRTCEFADIQKMRLKARCISYVNNIIPCKTCELRYICGGGCRVDTIPEISNIDINENRITFYRECSQEYKDKMYSLMVESSEFMYW